MAPRGGAVAALKDTLVKQFGACTREIVEAEVEGRLQGRTRLDREDLDLIEKACLSAARQRRGANPEPRSMRQRASATAPLLRQASSPAMSSAARSNASQFHFKAPPTGQSGSSGSGGRRALATPALSHSATDSHLPPHQRRREPPYGLAITSDDCVSERSCVIVRPRYPVPLRPKLKPMDHWDLIVAFDAEKHRQEELAFQSAGKWDAHARFRGTLDGQMDELRALRDQSNADKKMERDNMQAQLTENRRLDDKEAAVLAEKTDKMKKANAIMMDGLKLRDEKVLRKKQKEQEDVINWMNSEKARQVREREEQAVEYAKKCKTAREQLEAVREFAEQQKLERKAEEKKMCAANEKAMDAAEAGKKGEVADRMAKLDEISKKFGAAIEKRDREEAETLEARIKKVQEESERLSKEDAERRRTDHNKKVKEMLEVRAKQVVEREKDGNFEIVANQKQAAIWSKQLEDGNKAEVKKLEGRREARGNLDTALIDQMRESLVVHPLQFGITDKIRKQELAMNRVLFEQMANEDFHEDLLGSFLSKATDKGRLDRFGTVGPSGADIHELEYPDRDVEPGFSR